jgi:hypothetical protein
LKQVEQGYRQVEKQPVLVVAATCRPQPLWLASLPISCSCPSTTVFKVENVKLDDGSLIRRLLLAPEDTRSSLKSLQTKDVYV